MRLLDRLTLRQSLLLVLFCGFAAAAGFAGTKILREMQVERALAAHSEAVRVITHISALVHRLQEERGIGAIQRSGGPGAGRIAARLAAARAATDSALEALRKVPYRAETFAWLGASPGTLAAFSARLDALRAEVGDGHGGVLGHMRAWTGLTTDLTGLVKQAALAMPDGAVGRTLLVRVDHMRLQDGLGQERALSSAALRRIASGGALPTRLPAALGELRRRRAPLLDVYGAPDPVATTTPMFRDRTAMVQTALRDGRMPAAIPDALSHFDALSVSVNTIRAREVRALDRLVRDVEARSATLGAEGWQDLVLVGAGSLLLAVLALSIVGRTDRSVRSVVSAIDALGSGTQAPISDIPLRELRPVTDAVRRLADTLGEAEALRREHERATEELDQDVERILEEIRAGRTADLAGFDLGYAGARLARAIPLALAEAAPAARKRAGG